MKIGEIVKRSEERHARLLAMFRAGTSVELIAKDEGCGRARIYQILKRAERLERRAAAVAEQDAREGRR